MAALNNYQIQTLCPPYFLPLLSLYLQVPSALSNTKSPIIGVLSLIATHYMHTHRCLAPTPLFFHFFLWALTWISLKLVLLVQWSLMLHVCHTFSLAVFAGQANAHLHAIFSVQDKRRHVHHPWFKHWNTSWMEGCMFDHSAQTHFDCPREQNTRMWW